MLMRKSKSLLLVVTMVLMLSGCSISTYKDTLTTPIVHNIYSYNGKTTADVLSIYNLNGDVKISKSDTNNLKVVGNLIQTKQLKDINIKLDNLLIKPKSQNGVFFYEPLYSNNTTRDYWDWIKTNLNANGIQVNFDVQIPSTIKEVRIYSEIGNINLENITARIYAQTNIGNITGENLNPLDSAIFKVNVPSKLNNGIKVKFSSLDNVNDITAGVTLGNMTLNLPSGAMYTHNQVEPEAISIKYPYSTYSKKQFQFCREKSLEIFKPTSSKHGKTIITTNKLSNVSFKNK